MTNITPYIGTDNIKFDMSFDEVRNYLKSQKVQFNSEHWPNKGCTPEVAWDIIRVGDFLSIFFAKGKMFKMYFENSYTGALINGIRLGMSIENAKTVDSTIKYDDWEEEYVSENGYWLETDVETEAIISIAIFIKEVEDDDIFYSYQWC